MKKIKNVLLSLLIKEINNVKQNYCFRDITKNDHQFLFDLLKASMYQYYKETFGHWDDKEEWNFMIESLLDTNYQIILVDDLDVGCLAFHY